MSCWIIALISLLIFESLFILIYIKCNNISRNQCAFLLIYWNHPCILFIWLRRVKFLKPPWVTYSLEHCLSLWFIIIQFLSLWRWLRVINLLVLDPPLRLWFADITSASDACSLFFLWLFANEHNLGRKSISFIDFSPLYWRRSLLIFLNWMHFLVSVRCSVLAAHRPHIKVFFWMIEMLICRKTFLLFVPLLYV